MRWEIPLFRIYWDEQEVAKINAVVRRGMFWTAGPEVEEFEEGIAQYIGTKYAVVFSSGTSALHAVLLACEVCKDDEVIVPSFTFVSTASAALFVGARPVFAEIEERTYGLDPEDVERRITPRTKAIIAVHYAGCPCSIVELKEIAQKHDLILIEDAAESFGAGIDGRKVGTFGDVAILSFCQNKVITTGEGGAVVTNSKEICERLRLIRSHGRPETTNYFCSANHPDYVTLGYNFRMSSITAALGIAQLEKVDQIIQMRRNNALYMNERLSHIDEIVTPQVPSGFLHVYQMYTIRLKESGLRDKLMQYLSEKGIMTKVYFSPIHLTQFYSRQFGYQEGELPLTEKISSEVLTLPMYPTLAEEEMDYIVERVKEFFWRGKGDNE